MTKKYNVLLKHCLHNNFMDVLKSEPIWLTFVADICIANVLTDNYKLIPNINTNNYDMANS